MAIDLHRSRISLQQTFVAGIVLISLISHNKPKFRKKNERPLKFLKLGLSSSMRSLPWGEVIAISSGTLRLLALIAFVGPVAWVLGCYHYDLGLA